MSDDEPLEAWFARERARDQDGCCGIACGGFLALGMVVLVYVAAHFILKYW